MHSDNESNVTPKNILLVEDDFFSQQLVQTCLTGNVDLYIAESVRLAKKVFQEAPIDIVLLDLSLKGYEDGLDFAKYIRKKSQAQKTPIIAITAHAIGIDQEECLKAGCDEYMTKPFKCADLLDRLEKYFT
jgi:DNA-binding response OmpR family regulator